MPSDQEKIQQFRRRRDRNDRIGLFTSVITALSSIALGTDLMVQGRYLLWLFCNAVGGFNLANYYITKERMALNRRIDKVEDDLVARGKL